MVAEWWQKSKNLDSTFSKNDNLKYGLFKKNPMLLSFIIKSGRH